MTWLTNLADPETYPPEASVWVAKAQADFLRGKVIGPPQATSTYTVDQLRAMGMIGVYSPGDTTAAPSAAASATSGR